MPVYQAVPCVARGAIPVCFVVSTAERGNHCADTISHVESFRAPVADAAHKAGAVHVARGDHAIPLLQSVPVVARYAVAVGVDGLTKRVGLHTVVVREVVPLGALGADPIYCVGAVIDLRRSDGNRAVPSD